MNSSRTPGAASTDSEKWILFPELTTKSVRSTHTNAKLAITPQHLLRAGHAFLRRGKEAIIAFSMALERDLLNFAAYLGRGATHHGAGDYERAIVDFNSALNLDTLNVKAYWYRDDCCARLNEHEPRNSRLDAPAPWQRSNITAGIAALLLVFLVGAAKAQGCLPLPPPPAYKSLAEAVAALGSNQQTVREEGARSLRLICPLEQGLVVPPDSLGKIVNAALYDSSANVRSELVDVLGHISPASENLRRAVEQLLGDTNPLVEASAARALGSIGARGDSVIANRSALALATAILQNSNEMVAGSCAYSLSFMREKAVPALPLLRGALKDSSRTVRFRAMTGLFCMGPKASPAVADLIDILAGPNEQLGNLTAHYLAARALEHIGQAAAPAVPALVKALESDDPGTKYSVVGALQRIGAPAYPAVPELIRLLKDKQGDFKSDNGCVSLRRLAISVLERIGPKAHTALPALEQIAGKGPIPNSELSDRSWARQAIRAIRGKAKQSP